MAKRNRGRENAGQVRQYCHCLVRCLARQNEIMRGLVNNDVEEMRDERTDKNRGGERARQRPASYRGRYSALQGNYGYGQHGNSWACAGKAPHLWPQRENCGTSAPVKIAGSHVVRRMTWRPIPRRQCLNHLWLNFVVWTRGGGPRRSFGSGFLSHAMARATATLTASAARTHFTLRLNFLTCRRPKIDASVS